MSVGCANECGTPAGYTPQPVRMDDIAHDKTRVRLYVPATRRGLCARCDLARRRCGVWWCGIPWPIRAVLTAWRWVRRKMIIYYPGCGCLLDVKWRIGRASCPYKVW